MRNKLNRLIKANGFHIILLSCISVLAITTVLVSKNKLARSNKDNVPELEDFIIMDGALDLDNSLGVPIEDMEMIEEPVAATQGLDAVEEETVKEPAASQELDAVSRDTEERSIEAIAEQGVRLEEDKEPEDSKPVEEDAAFQQGEAMIAPIKGEMVAGFTKDNLVYSETLEEWTGHKGIDICAKEGSHVNAALPGIIQEVYNDELWGIVVIVDHGNGLVTKYANLSTDGLVGEDEKVDKGDAIGKVGKTALIEMMMEPHLHFEIIKDGINIDPMEYLP